MAVAKVSIALEYSPAAASDTARAIAELLTVLFLFIISSNSVSLICGCIAGCGGCSNGAPGIFPVGAGHIPPLGLG